MTASRASGESRTAWRITATSRTSSNLRSLPLMCRAFKGSRIALFLFARCTAKYAEILLRQRCDFHVGICYDVCRLAFGQQCARIRTGEFVAKDDYRLPHRL